MSQEHLDLVRRGYDEFLASGRFVVEIAAPDFVWDMSHFSGWPEQQVYEGVAGAEAFLGEWTAAWGDWELDVDELHDAGGKGVALLRQRGRSKATGVPVDMSLAQVWTGRDGRGRRM